MLKRWFHENFLSMIVFSSTLSNAQCGKTRNSLPCKFFPSNQFIVKFFSKTLLWRNFCEKNRGSKIPTVWKTQCGKTRNSLPCHANFFPSNQFIVMFFSKTLLWRNFCEKTVGQWNSEYSVISTRLCNNFLYEINFWWISGFSTLCYTLWKLRKFTAMPQFFRKYSVKLTFYQRTLL